MNMWLAVPQQGTPPRLRTLKLIEALAIERCNLMTVVGQGEPVECDSRRLTLQRLSETPAHTSSMSPPAENCAVLCQSWRICTMQFRKSMEETPEVTSKHQRGQSSARIGRNQYIAQRLPVQAITTVPLRKPIGKENHS
jgi:hypothetical protein